jgi:hypothetical protein
MQWNAGAQQCSAFYECVGANGWKRESDAKDGEVFERNGLLRPLFQEQKVPYVAIQRGRISRNIDRKERVCFAARFDLERLFKTREDRNEWGLLTARNLRRKRRRFGIRLRGHIEVMAVLGTGRNCTCRAVSHRRAKRAARGYNQHCEDRSDGDERCPKIAQSVHSPRCVVYPNGENCAHFFTIDDAKKWAPSAITLKQWSPSMLARR